MKTFHFEVDEAYQTTAQKEVDKVKYLHKELLRTSVHCDIISIHAQFTITLL